MRLAGVQWWPAGSCHCAWPAGLLAPAAPPEGYPGILNWRSGWSGQQERADYSPLVDLQLTWLRVHDFSSAASSTNLLTLPSIWLLTYQCKSATLILIITVFKKRIISENKVRHYKSNAAACMAIWRKLAFTCAVNLIWYLVEVCINLTHLFLPGYKLAPLCDQQVVDLLQLSMLRQVTLPCCHLMGHD